MAGHSKWAQVKYRKAITDAKRAKVFTKISSLISLASRRGSDPASNFSLREAIARAREVNMPQENIERAIRRSVGDLPGESVEDFILEAYGPEGIALLIHVITNNRNRAVNEIREILKNHEGKLAEAGSVKWLFEETGRIMIRDDAWSEELELWLIEQGVKDIKRAEEGWLVYIEKERFEDLRTKLAAKNIALESRLEFLAKNELSVKNDIVKNKLALLFEAIDDNENAEEIYSNAAFA